MIWWVFLACGQPDPGRSEATKSEEPEQATDQTPTADQVLLAHTRATHQCELLEKESYKFTWSTVTEDGHREPRVEEVLHQGKPGFSYTRIHQQREPSVRFVAFGRTPQGKFWSAGDKGVQPDLPEEMVAPLLAGMDPTPVCNFEDRWPNRVLVGPEDRDGTPTWRVKVSWQDGTGTDLWFHREHDFLVASEASVGEVKTTTELSNYREFFGILWPGTEVAVRQEGPIKITTTQTLGTLAYDLADFKEIGPAQVSAILAGK